MRIALRLVPFAAAFLLLVGAAMPADAQQLKVEDVKAGTGAPAVAGKTVTAHYTGTLTDGTKFDSSKDRGRPFSFRLGGGQVIRGWDEGVVGMREGGVRKLTVPPHMGYGDRAAGKIPPNSTLVFEIELIKVE